MMFDEIRVRAYAKINFGLKVLPRRKDGFHNIESVFQTIDLYDELVINWQKEKNCLVQCNSMNLPLKNTLTLAYEAFCEITRIDVPGIKVDLIKGIPSGGGLGGGSSDAAALIRALQEVTGITLSESELDYIASKTGSDVFFFMHCKEDGKGCALVSGRGEVIKTIPSRNDLVLVLVFPDESSSTKEAYDLVDEMIAEGKDVKCPAFEELEQIYMKDISEWTFRNTFTAVIAQKLPSVGNAINELKNVGCCYAEMSGSGSTVFGAFTSELQAERCCNLLDTSWNCKLVRTI